MKWTEKEVKQLVRLCEKEVPNSEIAKIMKISLQHVHAKRSQMGITREKIKAAKGSAAAPAAAPITDPWPPIAKAFDRLDKTLLDASAIDPENAQHLRQVAGGISILKSLLLDAVR